MSPSKQQQTTSIYSNHLKSQFAHRFVRALNNLNNTNRSPPHDDNQLQIYRRSRRVKLAAYTAMASVVGSRRAWSRAVLWKIRNRSRNKGCLMLSDHRKIRVVDHKFIISSYHINAKIFLKRRNNLAPKRELVFNKSSTHSGQESKLRKLIPGAETMDSWCLMGETADYIKCLAAQVEVMKTLVDLYSTT